MAAKIEPILTIADLDAMPEDGNRYELIEGELFVSCAPNLKHQGILRDLIGLFLSYLDRYPIGQIYPGPGVIFSDFSGVIPDLVFVSNERLNEIAGGDKIKGAPELIIEILSPGAENERRDRHVKRQLYKKYGVKEYWVVNVQRREIEVYRTARLRLVATLGIKDELTSPLLPGFRCPVKAILP
ncbi:MAG TPA: Uma2 family endonuclease [Blastocatellia bacterium]|nr:Uma2 family endonuclease [Blastocatellia bacterium]